MLNPQLDSIKTTKDAVFDDNLSIYSINTDEISVRVLPLPSLTDDGLFNSELATCIHKNSNLLEIDKTDSIFIRASSSKRPQMMIEKKNFNYDASPHKIFAKMRTNSTNIVNAIKKFPRNSYSARKEKYIKSLQNKIASRNSNSIL